MVHKYDQNKSKAPTTFMADILYPLLGLLAASALLMLGAEILIKACKLFSRALDVSEAFSGITLMSIATSSPEIFVSLGAHFSDHTALALGNLAGSNIANILLVYGLGCLLFLKPNHSRSLMSRTDMIAFVLSSLAFFLVIFYGLYSFLAGALLLLFYCGYIGFSYITEHNGTSHKNTVREFSGPIALKLLAFSLAGAVVLYAGSELIIYSGTSLARIFNIPESTIGLTAVAVGTSLPELVVLLLSARRMSEEFVIANIIGSNVFNITLIPGLMFLILPTQAPIYLENIGVIFFALCSLLFIIKSQLSRRFSITSGAIFLMLYAAFIYRLAA
ncbi:MAG: sodium:calcium antiporter [Pseudomonadota bacterium]